MVTSYFIIYYKIIPTIYPFYIFFLLKKSDLWMTYHEEKEKVHGLTLDKAKGKSILARAAQW